MISSPRSLVARIITGGLIFQNPVKVAFAMQDADNYHRLALYEVKDAHVLKPFDRPATQVFERGITQRLRRAHIGHAQ
jgi:hypothetical protein